MWGLPGSLNYTKIQKNLKNSKKVLTNEKSNDIISLVV